MVLEEVIKECSSHLGGVSAFGSTFSVLAYADDTVLLADLLPQLELAVNLFGVTASKMGL
uniref:Reverse transcriptase [Danio rerio] n=1 Tax=Lepeophtheirus salmonis TaxID=72036 RepID=A0A0K2TFX5_LEPSM